KAGGNKVAILINSCVASDVDGDGLPDTIDPCTNVGHGQDFVASKRPRITLTRINADATTGDDQITIQGSFTLAVNDTFAGLAPLTRGARVILQNRTGVTRVDGTLGGGSFTGKGTRGWHQNRAHTAWTYRDMTGSPLNGITLLRIKDEGRTQARRVTVNVTGKKGGDPGGARGPPPGAGRVAVGQTRAVGGVFRAE